MLSLDIFDGYDFSIESLSVHSQPKLEKLSYCYYQIRKASLFRLYSDT